MITLAKSSGFCPGVKRAVSELDSIIKNNPDARIYTLGDIIHNRIFNESLLKSGIGKITFDELDTLPKSEKVILVGRTHGITLNEEEILREKELADENFSFIDLTCPFVKKVHKIAEEETNEKSLFLLFSDKNHPEALGTVSRARGEKMTFSSIDELKDVDFAEKKAVFASQTTQNLKEFKKIKLFSKNLCTNAIFFDTI